MRVTLKEMEAIVAAYVKAELQAGTFTASKDNLAGLTDKIAKTLTIDGIYTDKLSELDGEELPYGKTIEEWFQDLVAVEVYNDYKTDDANSAYDALKPYYPSYEDCAYSYTLGRKVIPTTIKYDEYERAVTNGEELARITNMILKRLYDTYGVFKYDCKKQILANAVKKCDEAMSTTGATPVATANATFAVTKGTRYSNTATGEVAIGVKTDATAKTWANNVKAGNIVVYNLVETLAKPVDTQTGEAFVESVKKKVEDGEFISEGNALNGATIGAAEGLYLFVKKGLRPILDVQVEAGAFNPDKLAIPAKIVVVDDIPTEDGKTYAILADTRAMRLHPTYMAIREQLNGRGDYMNYFLHTENTAFISKNCFLHVWKDK
mgnify:FL=1